MKSRIKYSISVAWIRELRPGYVCFMYVTVHWTQTINPIAYARVAFPRLRLKFCWNAT